MRDTAARASTIIMAATALALTACGDDPEEATDDPAADATSDGDPDAEVEVDEDVDASDVAAHDGMFGIAFEGLWRFDRITEAAVVADPDADLEALVTELADEPDVLDVDVVADEVLDERADLELLLPPDEPTPPVLSVTAADHDAAVALEDVEEREEVTMVFTPTCGALAGTARHVGVTAAEDRLDEAGCDEVAVIDADDDAEPSWVAAAGSDDQERCIATAAGDAAASLCHERDEGHPTPLATQAGGFVVGFAPEDTASVEVDDGSDTVTVDTVVVAEGTLVFAAHLPDPDGDTEVVEAPDIAEVDARFLDEDGEVIDQP